MNGDGTLNTQGGNVESGGNIVDHATLALQELRLQQEAVGTMIDDLQTTLFDPLSANFPGLAVTDHPFSLPDEDGHEWTFTPDLTSGNPKASRVFVDGKMEKPFQGQAGGTVLVNVRAIMDRGSVSPLSSTAFRSPDDGISFMEKKIGSILAPIKAAQEAVAGALPRWTIGPDGVRELTIPPKDPQEEDYIDFHP